MQLAKKHINQKMRATSIFSKAGKLYAPDHAVNRQARDGRPETPKAMWGMDDGADSKTAAEETSEVEAFSPPQSPGEQQVRKASTVAGPAMGRGAEAVAGPPSGPAKSAGRQPTAEVELQLEEL